MVYHVLSIVTRDLLFIVIVVSVWCLFWFCRGVFGGECVELLELHVRESRPDLADRFKLLLR